MNYIPKVKILLWIIGVVLMLHSNVKIVVLCSSGF